MYVADDVAYRPRAELRLRRGLMIETLARWMACVARIGHPDANTRGAGTSWAPFSTTKRCSL